MKHLKNCCMKKTGDFLTETEKFEMGIIDLKMTIDLQVVVDLKLVKKDIKIEEEENLD